MAKNKIAVGQCYETEDKIYEVISEWKSVNKKFQGPAKFWWMKNVLTKEMGVVPEESILRWRRPFNTEG